MHMDYCLDKARRLTHNNEYRLVYKHGKYEVGRMCVLYRMPVVIVGRGPLKNATYEKAEKEILYLLRKSKLLIQNDK